MSGADPAKSGNWRSYVEQQVAADIVCLNPLRDDPEFIPNDRQRDTDTLYKDLRHGIGTVARNKMDILKSDLLLANVLDQERFSIGTVGEIFWADAFRKPIVLVKKRESIYNHDMLDAICHWTFESLDEAVKKINILLSSVKGNGSF